MELPEIPRESEDAEKSICIIGAGPSGLAALKIILDTHQFKKGLWNPAVFEARQEVGGVWVPASPTDDPPITPLYDSLTTNIPHPIMAYTSFPFPPSTPLYPKASYVLKYLHAYAEHFKLNQYINFRTSVQSVERDTTCGRWKITSSTGQTRLFDLVIVANGHYREPRYPDIPGLQEWLAKGKAMHSAWYRHPQDLGRTLLVIGAGPSGQDISTEMAEHATTVIHSVTDSPLGQTGNIKHRGRVTELKDSGEVVFEDGTSEAGVDFCIFATGYKMSFPFLSEDIIENQIPPTIPPLPHGLFNSSYSVFPLVKHIFPLHPQTFPSTSLAFMGLLIKVAPFPLVEAQAQMIVHAFAHPESFDSTRESVDIVTRYENLLSENQSNPNLVAKYWHVFEPLDQFDYRDELHRISGVPVTSQEWEKEVYLNKGILRKFWVDLERKGVADKWVRGVGKGGLQEWVDLMRKMIKQAQDEGTVSDPSAKL
ncbi:FAD/NAD(P)-binding domain-containing protein [Marasmius fiardii PR-910]|nr:FAD/NAD(P)-binding domain-containing protein [Marasmius fiardii PR-910]